MSRKEFNRGAVLARVATKTITLTEAVPLLGISYRQAKRLWRRYRVEDVGSLVHVNVGRGSNHAVGPAERATVVALIRQHYGRRARRRRAGSSGAMERNRTDASRKCGSSRSVTMRRPTPMSPRRIFRRTMRASPSRPRARSTITAPGIRTVRTTTCSASRSPASSVRTTSSSTSVRGCSWIARRAAGCPRRARCWCAKRRMGECASSMSGGTDASGCVRGPPPSRASWRVPRSPVHRLTRRSRSPTRRPPRTIPGVANTNAGWTRRCDGRPR